MCRISILMPVYNGEKYLAEAIESVLQQTYKNFELIILFEYGSNQESLDIIERYTDTRMRIIKNEKRLGLPLSLNRGIQESKGEFIARMDADDISYPKRLEYQVRYMDAHPEIIMSGSFIRINGKKILKYETDADNIKFASFFGCPFAHPTVIWRKDYFQESGLMYKNIDTSEDYELWMQVINIFKTGNIKKPLLFYRVTNSNRSKVYNNELKIRDIELKKQYFSKFGIDYNFEGELLGQVTSNKEVVRREDILKQICQLWSDGNCIKKQLERRIINFYLTNDILSLEHYWNEFSYIYNEKVIEKLRLGVYFFYRRLRHKVRLMLQKYLDECRGEI